MAKKSLVIVESPTKAKTIRKFLPPDYIVEASMGHVRDLPQSASDIPEKFKKEEWAKVGVNVDQDFEPLYVVPKGKSKILTDLRRKMAECETLYLATDEDREGESISWHLLETLKPKIPVKRMVFHEITKAAIQKALKDTRELDFRLVKAQESRRILDRLVGYTVSPLIWKKIAYGLSAGRVQSAGLRLIVTRERERMRFKSGEYWDLSAVLTAKGVDFEAKSLALNGTRIATSKDFDEATGKLFKPDDVTLLNSRQAQDLATAVKSGAFRVVSVEEKANQQRPPIPFITSTLQQEANRKLGLSARDAMRVAQSLYEQGYITYMRTDSPSLSQEAIGGARNAVAELFGKEYLSAEPRQFSAKNKGAQEAHEAIRPAGAEFQHPKETGLSGREFNLYEMIWMRTLACQMAEAKKLSLSVRLEVSAGKDVVMFGANGSRILFPGFLRAYVEGSDDPEAELLDREVVLPELAKGDQAKAKNLSADVHHTQPPARFTEASLVQQLEKEGIGRPSTYASIIDTILDRGYVRKLGNALAPTFTGIAVVQLLERHFNNLVDYKFTSEMERRLDEIAEGTREWLPYLKEFFSGKDGLAAQVKSQDKAIDPEASRTIHLEHLKNIDIKIGRYGAYLVKPGTKENDFEKATIPDEITPADLTQSQVENLLEVAKRGPESLGKDPETGLDIYLLSGRYGPYVQLGPVTDDQPKPKRASLMKGMDPKTLTYDDALKLISLPRTLGLHPVSGKPVQANQGRFGPFVVHDGDFRSLKKDDDLFTVTLARGLELLAEEKKGRRGPQALKDVGEFEGHQIQIMDGKFGLYLKWDEVNAQIPKDLKANELTLDQAIEIVKARREVAPAKPKRGRKKP